MPQNQQYDGLQFDKLYFPYNRITAELDPTPRLVRGTNAFITRGGKLAKRPGTVEVLNFGSVSRCDRLYLYETQETPSKLFILGSFFQSGIGQWELFYNRPALSTGWVSLGSTRSLSASTAPHEVVISRGLAYIKSFPAGASSDKFGTSIFDGTSLAVRLWGIPGPTVPARISGRVTRLSASINDITTTINVVANFSPAVTPPFTIQVDYEQMQVTSVGGGTNWTVTRGFNGTTPDVHDDDTVVLYRDWAASDHQVDVNHSWAYTYAWKSVTGHISNRAPLETNPDLLPSNTGPFFDLIPKITFQGHADTTNITHIIVYRTSDGGGTFFRLEEIVNTGAGGITYLDDSLGTGPSSTTFNDPLPDSSLDQANVAPSLVSNTVPPTVLPPGVIGTDTPSRSTPIVSFSGRLWYAIGNVLFYSGQEEITEGIPEEAWPAGIAGNFFRLQYPVVNLAATDNALYIFTQQNTYVLTGSNRETFNVTPLYENLGALAGNPRAITRYGNKIAFLSHDLRVVQIEGTAEPVTLSDPLFTDLIDQFNLSSEMEAEIKYWRDLDKEWLIVSIHHKTDPTRSKHWVYDIFLSQELKQHFWFVPWRIPSTAVLSGRIAENQGQRRLTFMIYDPLVPYSRMARIDPTARQALDLAVGTVTTATTAGIDFNAETHLHLIPPGNHVNQLRVPGLTPNVQYISIERTFIPGDDDPDIFYYKDDFWSDPISVDFTEDPARRGLSKAYKTIQAHINEVAYRFAFRMSKVNSGKNIEIQSYAIIWSPDSGA